MAIIRIQFRDQVGSFGEGWTASKELGKSEVIEKGGWLVFSLTVGTGVRQRIRVPIGNVSSITEEDLVEGAKKEQP